MSSQQPQSRSRTTKDSRRRIVTCINNCTNYKKVLFFPYSPAQRFKSYHKKVVDVCSKWVDISKTNKYDDAPIICHQGERHIPIYPPFSRKLKDCFLPRHPNRKFLPHQKSLIDKFKENIPESYLLYWEMGSGKTLGILAALFSREKIPPKITIVCSISMIDYWLNNILDFDTKDNTFQVEIMGYSYFENKFLEKENVTDEFIIGEMRKRVVIVDEAHHYRNMTETMKRAIRKLSCTKNLLLLTGTPLVNSAEELEIWSSFLRRTSGGENELVNKMGSLSIEDGSSAKQRIKHLRNKVMYFHPTMNSKMKENNSYPDIEYETVSIPMTWKQTLVYLLSQGKCTFADTIIISGKNNNGLSLHKQVANGFKDKNDKFISPKNEYIIDAIKHTDKYPLPFVIYSGNLETGVEDIFMKLKQNNVSADIITGDTDAIKRQEIVDKYNEGKTQILLISRVGNEGINLLGTGTLFITTRHENEESAKQTKARVVRYESHLNTKNKKVKIVDLISVFPKSQPTSEEKRELSLYMSQKLREPISGDSVVQEMRQKMEASGNISVEEHLNKLNKKKELELKPYIDNLKEIGKEWWTPPPTLVKKDKTISSKMIIPATKRRSKKTK